MREVYNRQINQDCTAYQAFKDLVTDRAENKGTLSVQKTDGKITGLQCANHRFYHSKSGFDRKAMVDLRQEFFGAIYDEIESNADIQSMLKNATEPDRQALQDRIAAVLRGFRECILPSNPNMNLDFKRTDMELIIKNVEKLKENLSVDALLTMDAHELVHLAEEQASGIVKDQIDAIKAMSGAKSNALKTLDDFMPKKLQADVICKSDDSLLKAGTNLLRRICPGLTENAAKGSYRKVLEEHVTTLTVDEQGALMIKPGADGSMAQVLADLKRIVSKLDSIDREIGLHRDETGHLGVCETVKKSLDDFIADVKASMNDRREISLDATKLAAEASDRKAVRYSKTLHDIGSRFGRELSAAVMQKDIPGEERQAAIEKSLRDFAGGMFSQETLDTHAEEFKAIAAKLSDPEQKVDFFDGFNQAVDLLETCKETRDRPVDKARCERKIGAFMKAFVDGQGKQLNELSGADRGALAAMGASRAAAKGQKPLVAFLKETFKEHFSALGSGSDEDKKVLKDALKLLPHIALDMYKDDQKFDYAMKKLAECFTTCADRLDGQDAVDKKAFLSDFQAGFVEKIRSTRAEWKREDALPTVTGSQLARLGELASFACGGEGDQGGYMGISDGRIVRFLTKDGERNGNPFAEFEENEFAKTLFRQATNTLMRQIMTLIKGCSLETKDAVLKLLGENANGEPRGEAPIERTTIVEVLKAIAKEAVDKDGKTLNLDDIQPIPTPADTSLTKAFHLEGVDSSLSVRGCQIKRIENFLADADYKPQGKLDAQSKSDLVKDSAADVETPMSTNPYSSRIAGSTGTVWNIVDGEEDADVYMLDCADTTYFGGWLFTPETSQEEQVVQDTVPTLAKDLLCNGEIKDRSHDNGAKGRVAYTRLNVPAGWIGGSELQGSDNKQMDHTIGYNILAAAAPSFVYGSGSNDKRGNLLYFLSCRATALGDAEAAKMLHDVEMKPEDVEHLSPAERQAYDARQQKIANVKKFLDLFYASEDVKAVKSKYSLFMLLMFGGKNCGFDLLGDDTDAEFAKFVTQAKKIGGGGEDISKILSDAHDNYLQTMRGTFKGWIQAVNAKHDQDPEKRDRPLYLVIAAVGCQAFRNKIEDIAPSFAEMAVRYGGKIKFVFPNYSGDSVSDVKFREAFDRAYYKMLREKFAAQPEEVAFNIIESMKAIAGQPLSAAKMDAEELQSKIVKEMSSSVETCFKTLFGGKTPDPKLKEAIVTKLSKEESFDDGIADLLAAMREMSVVDEKGRPVVKKEAYDKFLATLEEFAVATKLSTEEIQATEAPKPPQKTLEKIVTDFELEDVDGETVSDDPYAAANAVAGNIKTILNGSQTAEEKAADVGIYLDGLYRMLFTGPEGQMPGTEEAQSTVRGHLDELKAIAEKLSRTSDKASVQEGIARLHELLLLAAGDWNGWNESMDLPIRAGGQMACARFALFLESSLNLEMK